MYANQADPVLRWIEANAAGNSFAASLRQSLARYGSLTAKQYAAVQRNLSRESRPESDIDLTDLPAGTYAVPDGRTRLKVSIRKPGKNSRWHGYVFVDDGAAYGQRRNYGRQEPGRKYRGDIQDALRAILRDPFEAATAYGKLTGTCCVCGRVLEDEDSVAAGIGPVCAGKFN